MNKQDKKMFIGILIISTLITWGIGCGLNLEKEERQKIGDKEYCLKTYQEFRLKSVPAYCIKYFN